jgi:hypothetical protein
LLKKPGRKRSGGSDTEEPLIEWEFDVKEPRVSQKLGNFSTPTLIKQCARFNRGKETGRVEAKDVAELLAKELTKMLELSEEGVVQSEVLKFEHANGFVNIFLQNE